jgi:hypothetical protein
MSAFHHLCTHGIHVRADRRDLSGGVVVYVPPSTPPAHVAEAVAQAIGFHAVHTRPELSGFAGYDCLRITIQPIGAMP